MWVLSTSGFWSAVEDRADKRRIIVRARTRSDAKAFAKLAKIPASTVRSTPEADYPFRVIIGRRKFANVLATLAYKKIRYTNFKDAVKKKDPRRAEIYMDIWAKLMSLEGDAGQYLDRRQEARIKS